MVGFPGVLAHQGGWDELLVIALPITLFVVLLRVANARAAKHEQMPDHSDERAEPDR